jgi:branched-subunit amino acid ABC-type transport system permease component
MPFETNLLQILFNSLISGSLYVLVGLGLTMTYSLTKFPNFAHAEFITLGAYIVYAMTDILNLGLISGIIVSMLITGFVGVACFLMVFRPLANRKGTMVHLMISSIGVGIFLRYAIQQIWGGQELHFSKVHFAGYNLGPLRVTSLWIGIILTAVILVIILHLILTQTKLGKAMRATSNNPSLAQASGIDIDKIIMIVWFLGAALAGLGGFFKAADTRIVPVLGWGILLPAFAVIILGGIGSFYGMIAAAYILGLAENFSIIGLISLGISTDYRTAIGFVVIIITLIFAPTGLSGINFSKWFKRRRPHEGEVME